jgi:hypothetical protein
MKTKSHGQAFNFIILLDIDIYDVMTQGWFYDQWNWLNEITNDWLWKKKMNRVHEIYFIAKRDGRNVKFNKTNPKKIFRFIDYLQGHTIPIHRL